MIVDLLNRKIKEMKELRRLESIKANKAQQEENDTKMEIVGENDAAQK